MYEPNQRVVELDKSVYVALMESLEPIERVMNVPGGSYQIGDVIEPFGLILYTVDPRDGDSRQLTFVVKKGS